MTLSHDAITINPVLFIIIVAAIIIIIIIIIIITSVFLNEFLIRVNFGCRYTVKSAFINAGSSSAGVSLVNDLCPASRRTRKSIITHVITKLIKKH